MIGGSQLHGVIAIALAVLIVNLVHQSYYLEVFSKMWAGLLLFGVVNAFILVPVILSFMGPTPDFSKKVQERERRFFRHIESLSKSQVHAMKFQYDFRDQLDEKNGVKNRSGKKDGSDRKRSFRIRNPFSISSLRSSRSENDLGLGQSTTHREGEQNS